MFTMQGRVNNLVAVQLKLDVQWDILVWVESITLHLVLPAAVLPAW
jgi:hypothetical protein